MALELVVFLQDPFINNQKEPCSFSNFSYPGIEQQQFSHGTLDKKMTEQDFTSFRSSSHEVVLSDGAYIPLELPVRGRRRKRKRERRLTSEKEMEKKRMSHITVERNRRKQMNEYLSVLRLLMPSSYALRSDQASIIEGTINFVKKLEQLLQFLEAHKQIQMLKSFSNASSTPLASFFNFPQYVSAPAIDPNRPIIASNKWLTEEKQSSVADIEVNLVETHATIKILARRLSKQLLRLVAGLYSLGLNVLHLNLTRFDHNYMVLYSFSVKVEDECPLTSVNDMATAVHELMAKIQVETMTEASKY